MPTTHALQAFDRVLERVVVAALEAIAVLGVAAFLVAVALTAADRYRRRRVAAPIRRQREA